MIILANVFPNAPILGDLEEDSGEGDTEFMESMSGLIYTNARRTTMPKRWRFTLWGQESNAVIVSALAVKAAAFGRLYGFKWTSPRDLVQYDVCFTRDDWMFKMEAGKDLVASAFYTAQIELKQVIGGIPAA